MKCCTKCGQSKDLSEFNFKIKSKNTYSPHCKTCSRIYIRAHYLKNKGYYLLKTKKRNLVIRTAIKNYLWDYLSKHKCTDCGESDPVVLEFDHISNDKLFNISEMARQKYTMNIIKNEISKCEIRCANCHRRKTALQFGWLHIKRAPVA